MTTTILDFWTTIFLKIEYCSRPDWKRCNICTISNSNYQIRVLLLSIFNTKLWETARMMLTSSMLPKSKTCVATIFQNRKCHLITSMFQNGQTREPYRHTMHTTVSSNELNPYSRHVYGHKRCTARKASGRKSTEHSLHVWPQNVQPFIVSVH